MRTFYLTVFFLCLTLPALRGSAEPALRGTAPAIDRGGHSAEHPSAIQWQKSLAAAKAGAARTGKPLFLLHLFGKLDETFC
jgi:hypothetical protein